jgi:hypothetical protein
MPVTTGNGLVENQFETQIHRFQPPQHVVAFKLCITNFRIT